MKTVETTNLFFHINLRFSVLTLRFSVLTLRFSVLTLSLSVLTLYMLFLHERTVSSVTDVTVVLQLFLRIYVI